MFLLSFTEIPSWQLSWVTGACLQCPSKPCSFPVEHGRGSELGLGGALSAHSHTAERQQDGIIYYGTIGEHNFIIFNIRVIQSAPVNTTSVLISFPRVLIVFRNIRAHTHTHLPSAGATLYKPYFISSRTAWSHSQVTGPAFSLS